MIAVAAILLAATLPASPSLETALSFGKLGVRPEAGDVRVENGKPRYLLTLDVALELYQNGKRYLERDQQWLLGCESPKNSREPGTSCRLTRTTLDHWGKAVNLGSICYQGVHTTDDHTLEVVAADWPGGKLDLNVVHADGSKTHVVIHLAYEKESIFLDSLTASLTLRGVTGAATTYELRVPDYTYVQQVPMTMKGMRTAWEGEWETLLRSLSPQDQAAARRLVAARQEIVDRVVQALFEAQQKQQVPENASPTTARETSDRLSAEAGATFLQYVTEWLESSEMSAPARASVIEFLRSH